jgi:hypothetical protein
MAIKAAYEELEKRVCWKSNFLEAEERIGRQKHP